MVLLSILIPTLESRGEKLKACLESLNHKEYKKDVEILLEYDNGEQSVGAKRNALLDSAKGEYVCFVDDDDVLGRDYLKHILEGIEKGVDCVSLRGVITFDGENPQVFEHSIKYDAWKTNDTGAVIYERYPNHLNAIKRSIASQFSFPPTNHGEDFDWSKKVFESGLIKTEHYVDAVTYHYKYVSNK